MVIILKAVMTVYIAFPIGIEIGEHRPELTMIQVGLHIGNYPFPKGAYSVEHAILHQTGLAHGKYPSVSSGGIGGGPWKGNTEPREYPGIGWESAELSAFAGLWETTLKMKMFNNTNYMNIIKLINLSVLCQHNLIIKNDRPGVYHPAVRKRDGAGCFIFTESPIPPILFSESTIS
jgi:hypothetical protein